MLSPSLGQSAELFRKGLDLYRALGRPVPAQAETSLQNKRRPAPERRRVEGSPAAPSEWASERGRQQDLAPDHGASLDEAPPSTPLGWGCPEWSHTPLAIPDADTAHHLGPLTDKPRFAAREPGIEERPKGCRSTHRRRADDDVILGRGLIHVTALRKERATGPIVVNLVPAY